MDENVLYKPPIPEQKSEETLPSKEVGFRETPPPSSPIPIAKILKILLGLFVIVLVGFLIFGFFIPKFFTGLKSDRIEITYWGLEREPEVLSTIISDFEAKYPQIKINYIKQDIGQYRERLIARIDNGTGPDIFRFHNTWVPMISAVLLPVPENAVSREDFSRNFYPVIKEDLVVQGAIYGIPLGIDTLSLYVNKDLFSASGLNVPTTWVDFVNYSRALTVKDEDNKIKTAGAAMGISNNIDYASDIVSMLMAQNGVDLKNISGNLPAAADALNFYVSFAVTPGNVWDETLDESLRAFANGSLAMYFGYARDYSQIKAINPDLLFEIHPVPILSDRNKTIASYWVEGVSSKTKHQKEAFIFLRYLSDRETELKLFAEEAKTMGIGEPYARRDLAESLKNNSKVYPFLEGAKNAVSSYFVDGTFDDGINTKMNSRLYSAIEVVLKGTSPESAAETFSAGFSQVLQEYPMPK
ncbi:MAG: extracellular solute-binding protein [Candidatus Levybacteria bacterium]|nr:extracellular solute-binding protein [Candidatus Levybacteria bacterium]